MQKYPFTPELLDALPEELAELYRGLEQTLLNEICSRLKAAGGLNEVTVQSIRALRAHGIDLTEIQQAIAAASGVSDTALEALFADVVARNQAYYTQLIDLAQVTAPETLLDHGEVWAIWRQTRGELRNLTQSAGFLVTQGRHRILLPPAQAYQWTLDQAALQVQSGAVGYNRAIAGAVRQLAASGLRTVSYESGHADSLDVAVRRAVMTGINQVNQQYREQSMDYLETDLVEVTAHSGARDKDGPLGWENHKKWQGKVYRWSGKPRTSKGEYPDFETTCGYGSVTGIGGANCRHSYWPYIEGVSERTYTDSDLAHIDDHLGCDFEGKHYSAYEATQKQRQIERSIRRAKREKQSYEAAGLTEETQATSIRLRRLNQEYRAFSQAAGLPEQRERLRVLDADTSRGGNSLANSVKSDILKETGGTLHEITEEAIQRVPQIQPDGWSQEQAERLQEAHRDLLRSVMDKPVGTEAGAIYSPDMRLIERRIGDAAAQQITMPRCHDPYILIHNHPSGELFSHTDIAPFAINENMQAITAVGNSGNVYMLIKTDDYDGFRFLRAYNAVLKQLQDAINLSDMKKYIAVMGKFLEEVGEYGAKFIKRG